VRAVTHLLDTSALLAHYFNEPGAEVVQGLGKARGRKPGISVLSVAELRGCLEQEVSDTAEVEDAARAYFGDLTECIPVDRAVAELAWHIRGAMRHRLPLIDALIAATARSVDAILVHKDSHMTRIPTGLVKTLFLG
jgi:predicted nucleic acid-binding protein